MRTAYLGLLTPVLACVLWTAGWNYFKSLVQV